MDTSLLLGLGAGVLAAVLFGVAAVAQASAVRDLQGRAQDLSWFLRHGWQQPLLVAVVVAYLAGFVLHAVAIWFVPLYLAQASISLSLPVTAVVAATRLGEPLGAVRWLCVLAVVAGLLLLALGSGEPGAARTTGGFVGLLWLGLGALALVGLALVGLAAGSGPGGWLGTLGGLGYAGSAVAVRAVGWPLDGLALLAALSVPAYGVLAFWLYSIGLDRGAVAAATGPLIVGQTFVPTLVGIWLLEDQVRAGWWPGVLAGLALATAGAIWLSRTEGRLLTGSEAPARR